MFVSISFLLDIALRNVDIPIISSDLKQNSENVIHKSIDRYYDAVTSCVRNACAKTIPIKCQNLQSNEYIVPGWNDYVNDKHDTARAAFLDWVYCGKPRTGVTYNIMRRTRSQFKLALRYCKQHS